MKKRYYMLVTSLIVLIITVMLFYLNNKDKSEKIIVLKQNHYLLYDNKTYISQPIITSERNSLLTKAISNYNIKFSSVFDIEKYELEPRRKEKEYYVFYLKVYFKETQLKCINEPFYFYHGNDRYELGKITIDMSSEVNYLTFTALEGKKDNTYNHLNEVRITTEKENIEEIYLGSKKIEFEKYEKKENTYEYIIKIPVEDRYILDETYFLIIDDENMKQYVTQYKYFITYEYLLDK